MKKLVTVGIVLAAALAMAAEANVPDVLTAIATRKSIRKFDPLRAVEEEKVEKVLKAAMCAPSAMDRRFSWRRPRRCARFWRFPMAMRRSTSSRSAIRRKIRR